MRYWNSAAEAKLYIALVAILTHPDRVVWVDPVANTRASLKSPASSLTCPEKGLIPGQDGPITKDCCMSFTEILGVSGASSRQLAHPDCRPHSCTLCDWNIYQGRMAQMMVMATAQPAMMLRQRMTHSRKSLPGLQRGV